MSAFVATHRVDVLRGELPDAYGDAADADVLAYRGLPAVITETSRTTWDRATGKPRTVRRARGRFRPGVSLSSGDRIRDVASGTRYVVVDVVTSTDLVHAADVVCDLRRVTPTG
ncbi:hypothetical protein ACG83_10690 [Frankia sp. R43]|uniref:hypothetical protein n=1 Tax=Frankia sp. R43 TaxID=269536 RepID=UPI0006CA580B|nr:hypothetical protein [Frankia sp. R43]KPM55737.1 hypothetical protein ACG83_10690 [Frankia sp. R43]